MHGPPATGCRGSWQAPSLPCWPGSHLSVAISSETPLDELLFRVVQMLADVSCHSNVTVNPGLMFPVALSHGTETDGGPVLAL